MPITKSLAYKRDGENEVKKPEMKRTLMFQDIHPERGHKGSKTDGKD